MKFIINFLFYGFLIYLLYRFLPQESFQSIVNVLDSVYDFLADTITWGIEKIRSATSS